MKMKAMLELQSEHAVLDVKHSARQKHLLSSTQPLLNFYLDKI